MIDDVGHLFRHTTRESTAPTWAEGETCMGRPLVDDSLPFVWGHGLDEKLAGKMIEEDG